MPKIIGRAPSPLQNPAVALTKQDYDELKQDRFEYEVLTRSGACFRAASTCFVEQLISAEFQLDVYQPLTAVP